MAITFVSGSGDFSDNANNAVTSFLSVTAGNLIVVQAVRYNNTSDPFVAGDCAKTSGTATLGAFSLDCQTELDFGGGSGVRQVGIFSAIVTGTGSLGITVSGNPGDYWLISSSEFNGTWDASRKDGAAATGGSATNNQTTAASGSLTSAGAGVFVGAMQVEGGGTITQTTGNSIFEMESSSHLPGASGYRLVGTSTASSFDWTIPSPNEGWIAGQVIYKEASAGTTLVVDSGALSVTGQSVPLDLPLAVGQATLSFTGSGFNSADGIAVDAQLLILAGQDVQITANANFVIPVVEVLLSITGQDLPFLLSVPWDETLLTIAGQDVVLTAGLPVSLSVTEGTVSITGQDVTFFVDVDYALAVTETSITLTGQDIGVLIAGGNVILAVDQSSLIFTSSDLGINPSYTLPATGIPRRKRFRGVTRIQNFRGR